VVLLLNREVLVYMTRSSVLRSEKLSVCRFASFYIVRTTLNMDLSRMGRLKWSIEPPIAAANVRMSLRKPVFIHWVPGSVIVDSIL
jgi:hypothetical protein